MRKPSPIASWWLFCHVTCIVLLLMGCARADSEKVPVQLVEVVRGDAPALAVFHLPDVRINALSPPLLALDGHAVVKLDRGAQTADSSYFAEPPWAPRDSLVGTGKLHVSFCRADEAYCTVHSYPVELK